MTLPYTDSAVWPTYIYPVVRVSAGFLSNCNIEHCLPVERHEGLSTILRHSPAMLCMVMVRKA